jgi:hypothetical protein
VPNNARRSNPLVQPSQTGDGHARICLSKDIDGEVGSPGTRQLVSELSGLIFSPRFDDVGSDQDMHERSNLAGVWMNLFYGGSTPSNIEAWSWIRKIEVFEH